MASDDDVFASLGGSLLRDILGTDGNDSDVATHDIISSLEAELDAISNSSNSTINPVVTSAKPPGLTSSAAALIVSHQQERSAQLLGTGLNNTKKSSIHSTNPLEKVLDFDRDAVADFLREDAARKKERTDEENMRKEVDKVLCEDEEEYNIDEKVKFLSSTMANTAINNNATLHAAEPPPGLRLSTSVTPSKPLQMHNPTFSSSAQVISAPLVQNGRLPSDIAPVKQPMASSESQSKHPQFRQPLPPPPQNNHIQMNPNSEINFHTKPVDMFPSIPPNTNLPMLPKQNTQQQIPNLPYAPAPVHFFPNPNTGMPQFAPHPRQPQRFYFCNPHPRAPPVPATSVPSSSMSSRDLTYVLHAMIRSMTVNSDNYFRMWIRDQSSKNEENAANKIKEQLEFRKSVEERASEWKAEKQVLGHVVKSNVHRPRALLNIEVTKSSTSSDEEDDDSVSARVTLWKSRKVVDVGYGYFLDGQWKELLGLFSAGLGENNGNLKLLLALPKGRNLVARGIDYMMRTNIALHVPLIRLLPHIVFSLFSHPEPRDKEDRVLHVCISMIFATANKFSVDGKDEDVILMLWIESLKASMQNDDVFKGMKKMLEQCVLRAEFLHTLLTAGGNLSAAKNERSNDVSSFVEDWRRVEKKFVDMLSAT